MGEKGFGRYICKGLEREPLTDISVISAMSRVPRHEFIPEAARDSAYEDKALPIGFGQTISQPFIVALMLQEAHLKPGDKVLEIGSGSGYQAAVLAELDCKVFTIEFVPELAKQAAEALKKTGYSSVVVRAGDGWKGWSSEAPFDAIIVAAASPSVPPELCRQLADGGRLIVPIEMEDEEGERLTVIERQGDEFIHTDIGAVRFVPLRGIARERSTTSESQSKIIH